MDTTIDLNDELLDDESELTREHRAALTRQIAAMSPHAKDAIDERLASYGRRDSGVVLSETDALELMLEHGCKAHRLLTAEQAAAYR